MASAYNFDSMGGPRGTPAQRAMLAVVLCRARRWVRKQTHTPYAAGSAATIGSYCVTVVQRPTLVSNLVWHCCYNIASSKYVNRQ